ncbi:MAG: lipoprotein [Saccharospirillum sp.]|nr:lipoprotein [Saccharospirillum sp.]
MSDKPLFETDPMRVLLMSCLFCLVAVASLAGCGQKGDLFLPDDSATFIDQRQD